MYMGSADAYVSKRDFKKLEERVAYLLEVHEADEKLTGKEKKRIKEVKKDIKTNKKIFCSLEEL